MIILLLCSPQVLADPYYLCDSPGRGRRSKQVEAPAEPFLFIHNLTTHQPFSRQNPLLQLRKQQMKKDGSAGASPCYQIRTCQDRKSSKTDLYRKR
jgi:hypothetical protein